MRVYKRTDRIMVRIDNLVVKLAPLSLDQKTEIQQAMLAGNRASDIAQLSHAMRLALKYSVKGIDGLINSDDQPYKLEFENDVLTDSCIDDLLNIELTDKLILVCTKLAAGVPKQFKSEKTGEPIPGVELIEPSKEPEEKKI